MKNKILALLLFAISFANAQSNDLAALADGKLTQFIPVKDYEKNSFYGYFALYDQGEVEKGKLKMEYVILDKNLNKVSNGNYIQGRYGSKLYQGYGSVGVEKLKDDLLIIYANPLGTTFKFAGYLYTYRKISLKENKITDETYYKGTTFDKVNYDDANFIGDFKRNEIKYTMGSINAEKFSGFYTVGTSEGSENLDKEMLSLYDVNKKKLWEYKYNEKSDKKNYRKYVYFKELGNNLVFKVDFYKKKRLSEKHLVAIDIATGKVNFDYLLEDKNSKFTHVYDYAIRNDKIYITGNYYKSTSVGFYDPNSHFGVFRIVLNAKGDVINEKYFPWREADNFIKIKDNGKVDDDNYKLAGKNNFIFDDGSISFLYEKYKPKTNDYNTYRTKEMVLMNFDENFKIKSADIVKKDKTRGFDQEDFLFSQYLNKRKDMVFFFQDKKKDEKTHDKNWVLGINKFISGKYSYEEIPISSKKEEYTIVPYYAKDGYILLREFNEKDDKYNQIRLEKLNL